MALLAPDVRAQWVLTGLKQQSVVTSCLIADDGGDCCDVAVVVLRCRPLWGVGGLTLALRWAHRPLNQ